MNSRHAIVLVIDGLRASALGAYGNTTYSTPHLDALASRAAVAEWLWADSPHQEEFYRSVWLGQHALRRVGRDTEPPLHLVDQLHESQVRQWLVSDDAWIADQSQALPFDEALLFDNDSAGSAQDLGETALGRFFTHVIERLHQWREDAEQDSSIAWLHSRGMFGPWDAPAELRAELVDEEDPDAPTFVQPPTELRDIDDPDVLLAHRVAYAAQVVALDACVGAFVQALEEVFADDETLLMLTSSRGFALGDHGDIGTECAELFGERLHVPWLVSPCGNATPLPRSDALWQPADVGATLGDWFHLDRSAMQPDGVSLLPHLKNQPCDDRELAVAAGPDELAIRTSSWMLRQSGANTCQLYSKPDDRWEHNDVAGLCPDIVDELRQALADVEAARDSDQPLPTRLKSQSQEADET